MFIMGGSGDLFFNKVPNLYSLLKKKKTFLFHFQLPKLSVTDLILVFIYGVNASLASFKKSYNITNTYFSIG